MPIADTKYNRANYRYNSGNQHILETKLEIELSCNSLFHRINATNENSMNNRKPYLTYKASYLINPFSEVSKCTNKFNNEKRIFKYRRPQQCHSFNSDDTTSFSNTQIQKNLQNQLNVPSSLYSMNISALNINSNSDISYNKFWDNRSDRYEKHGKPNQIKSSIKSNHGVDIKHNSYDRYLGKKKAHNLKSEKINNSIEPKLGNKTRKFGLINCTKSC